MRIIILLLLIFPLTVQAQHREEITSTFNEYLSYMENGEFNKSLDYLPEKFFQIVPREQMKAAIDQSFNNPAFAISMENGTINSISDDVTVEGTQYAALNYSAKMTIRMKEGADPSMFPMLRQSFEQQVGADKMTVNEEEKSIVVDQTSDMYAIKTDGGSWKFVENNPQLGQVLQQIIPAEAIEQLN